MVTKAGESTARAASSGLRRAGSGSQVQAALTTASQQRGPPTAIVGRTRPGQSEHWPTVPLGEVVQHSRGGGETVPETDAQLVGAAGPNPDQVSLSQGQHLDRLHLTAVSRDSTEVAAVGAYQLRQDLGVATSGLRPVQRLMQPADALLSLRELSRSEPLADLLQLMNDVMGFPPVITPEITPFSVPLARRGAESIHEASDSCAS